MSQSQTASLSIASVASCSWLFDALWHYKLQTLKLCATHSKSTLNSCSATGSSCAGASLLTFSLGSNLRRFTTARADLRVEGFAWQLASSSASTALRFLLTDFAAELLLMEYLSSAAGTAIVSLLSSRHGLRTSKSAELAEEHSVLDIG